MSAGKCGVCGSMDTAPLAGSFACYTCGAQTEYAPSSQGVEEDESRLVEFVPGLILPEGSEVTSTASVAAPEATVVEVPEPVVEPAPVVEPEPPTAPEPVVSPTEAPAPEAPVAPTA